MVNQDWFEMADIRHRKLNSSVWIPLRAAQELEKCGRYGYEGYREEFFGIGTVAVPIDKKDAASKLGWEDIGISHTHSGFCDNDKYVIADVFESYDGKYLGTHLVLDQHFNSVEFIGMAFQPGFRDCIGSETGEGCLGSPQRGLSRCGSFTQTTGWQTRPVGSSG